MQTFKIRNWEVPAVLLWVSLLAFGILIPWLGFYADDWPYLYTVHTFGPQGLNAFISWVRPFSAWVLVASAWLFGQSIWAYHVFILILRWLDAVLLFWFIQKLWPGMMRQAAWVALIFAIYPAFKQQTLPFEYLPHFVALAFLFLSFILMVEAVRGPKLQRALFILSLILSLGIFIIEYFAGLELLRPLLLGIVLYAQTPELKRLVKRVIVYWIPYLLVFIGFVLWRVFILKFPSYKPGLIYDLAANPLNAVVRLAIRIVKDLYTVTIGTWIQIFQVPTISRSSLLYLVIVIVVFISVAAYLWWMDKRLNGLEKTEDQKHSKRWSLAAIITGFYALLVSGWPIWVTKIPLTLTFAWDRATLPFIFGVSLVIPGLVNLIPWSKLQVVVLAVLIAFSAGLMFQNANLFRKEFTTLKQFYWQLSWRAPELKTGTAVVIDESPFNYHVDTSLTPLLNWTYAPQSSTTELPFSILDFHKVNTKYSTELEKGTTVHQSFFNYDFDTSSSSLLLVAFNPPGCLRVLSPQVGEQMLLPPSFKQELNLSNPNLIIGNEGTATPPAVLGENPVHDWCYYFEKADLAGQQGNWEEVVSLGKEAMQASLKPHYPSELVVFIEGFAHTGDWNQAHNFAKAMTKDPFFKSAACDTWNTLEQDMTSSPANLKILAGYQTEFGCNRQAR